MDEKIIEKLAKALYQVWKHGKEEQGYHLPALCPNYERKEEENEPSLSDDLIHCNKCLSELKDYEDISNFKKKKFEEDAVKFNNTLNENDLKLILKE